MTNRRLFPWLAALVLLLAAVLPTSAGQFAALPDNLGDLQKGSYVCTDATQKNCAPGVRYVASGSGTTMYADNGSGTPVPVYAGDTNNATSASNILKSAPVCRYNATLPTLTDTRYNECQVSSKGALLVGVINTTANGVVNPVAITAAQDPAANPVLAVAPVITTGGGFNRTESYADNSDSSNDMGYVPTAGLIAYSGSAAVRVRVSTVGTGQLVAAPPDYSYLHIAAGQATTVVKGSPGFLHAVCFNSAATATNVTTIYDNASTSGNVIAIPNAVAATVPNCITYDLKAALGIVIITTTANGSDMTVSYR